MSVHVGGRGPGHMCRKPPISGPPPFTPLSLFGAGQKGGWWEADPAVMYQGTTTGTTPAAIASPVGYMGDKSGNGLHVTQSGGQRPNYQQAGGKNYLSYDGVDDWMGVTFAAGTFGAAMDVLFAVQRVSGSVVPISNAYSGGNFLAVAQAGGFGNASAGAGAGITYYINGVAVPKSAVPALPDVPYSNRDDMNTAWTTGTPVVVEIQGADLSTWTGFGFGEYPGWAADDRIYGCVVRETMTSTERDNLRTYLTGRYS